MDGEKACFKCGKVLPLDEFYRHPKMSDGHVNKCKSCAKSDVRANYRANLDYYREYDKLRSPDQSRRALRAAADKRLRERHPLKKVAWHAVNNAVRDGRLFRLPCEVCGDRKTEAHHDDYSKPLGVRWLCRHHHKVLHGKIIDLPIA